jgi:Sulfotransferase family
MRRDELPPHKSATYVLPRWKVVYVSVPKAACTSLKWLIANLQEEDPGRFYTALTREVGRGMTIHRRRRWQRTPMLHKLSDEELADIAPERGWFVFAVVRHPTERLWSAWQSKFLLREPRWVSRFGDEPWFPRVPETTQEVVEDFQRFVRAIADDRSQLVMRDRHFQPQTQLVTPDRTPYTRIYKTREIPELLRDLGAHLSEQGREGALDLEARNETPLRPLASMFTLETTAGVLAVYGADFERFGYENVQPEALDPSGEYDEAAIRMLGRLVERGERIGDLAVRAQRLYVANNANRREVRKLRRRVAQLDGAASVNGGLARKVRRRVLGALTRA